MRLQQALGDKVSRSLIDEIAGILEELTVTRQLSDGAATGVPLTPNQGLVVLGIDEPDYPVVALSIPLARTMMDAQSMQANVKRLPHVLLGDMINTTISVCNDPDLTLEQKVTAANWLACFLIDYQRQKGVSVKKQISHHQEVVKTGGVVVYFCIIASGKSLLLGYEAGARLDPEVA